MMGPGKSTARCVYFVYTSHNLDKCTDSKLISDLITLYDLVCLDQTCNVQDKVPQSVWWWRTAFSKLQRIRAYIFVASFLPL